MLPKQPVWAHTKEGTVAHYIDFCLLAVRYIIIIIVIIINIVIISLIIIYYKQLMKITLPYWLETGNENLP